MKYSEHHSFYGHKLRMLETGSIQADTSIPRTIDKG